MCVCLCVCLFALRASGQLLKKKSRAKARPSITGESILEDMPEVIDQTNLAKKKATLGQSRNNTIEQSKKLHTLTSTSALRCGPPLPSPSPPPKRCGLQIVLFFVV